MARLGVDDAMRSDNLEPIRLRASRVPIAGALAAATSILFIVTTLMRPGVSSVFGIDFGVFYVGGSLVREGRCGFAYESGCFTQDLREFYPLRDGEVATHFISTPTFGWFAQPLSWLSFELSLGLWILAGVVALFVSVWVLKLPLWVVAVVAISPAMVFNTLYGQTGAFVLLLFVGVHQQMASGRVIPAGVVAGLMILKPPLAVGYGLLWLMQGRRYWRAIVAAAVTGLLVSIPTVLGGLGTWIAFIETMRDRAEVEGVYWQQALSIPEFLKSVYPQAPSSVTAAFWLAGVFAAASFIWAGRRKFGDDRELMSAVAVLATVLGSPHVLVYDTLVLIIPVAVLLRRGVLSVERLGVLAALYAVPIGLAPGLKSLQIDLVGRAVSLEFPALAVATWLAYRWLKETRERDGQSSAVDSVTSPGTRVATTSAA